jgi:hypothetical protein
MLFSYILLFNLLLFHIHHLYAFKTFESTYEQLLETKCKIFDKFTSNKQASKLKVLGNSAWERYNNLNSLSTILFFKLPLHMQIASNSVD